MNKGCCEIWRGASTDVEVFLAKKAKALPEFLQALFASFSQTMGTFCPSCGSRLAAVVKSGTGAVVSRPIDEVLDTPLPVPVCPRCKGAGFVGETKEGLRIGCNRCFGEGVIQTVTKRVPKERQDEIEQDRQKLTSNSPSSSGLGHVQGKAADQSADESVLPNIPSVPDTSAIPTPPVV